MINFPGPDKILMLLVIALVVIGPTRLPGAAHTAGKWIAELRKLTSRFQDEMAGALGEPKDAITSAMGDLTKQVGGWRSEMAGVGRTLTSAVIGTASPDTTELPVDPAIDATKNTDATTNTGATKNTDATTNTGATYAANAAPSAPPTSSVSSPLGMGRPLPPLPPAPDDPSLN